MFDQPEFLKHTAEDAVAELGNALLNVIDRETEREQSRVFDLEAIVKQGDTNGSTVLSVICMNDCIHDGFTDCNHWKGPEIRSFHGSYDCLTSHVLSQKRDHLLGSSREVRAYFY